MARPAATWHISMLTIKMLNVKKQLTSLKIPNFSYNESKITNFIYINYFYLSVVFISDDRKHKSMLGAVPTIYL